MWYYMYSVNFICVMYSFGEIGMYHKPYHIVLRYGTKWFGGALVLSCINREVVMRGGVGV